MSDEKLSEIFAKCWEDEAFKKRLIASPAAVFAEHGMEVPEGVTLHVVESTDNDVYVTLPPAPGSAAAVSDAELDGVAGGGPPIVGASPIQTWRRVMVRFTRSQSVSTCGKDCIPW